jgi:hypothetical protein
VPVSIWGQTALFLNGVALILTLVGYFLVSLFKALALELIYSRGIWIMVQSSAADWLVVGRTDGIRQVGKLFSLVWTPYALSTP